ncbi:MAG: TrmH family RNA methyltransferase [Planctomycetota bacterium]|nr:TrmH family RNA methyltransferase [Planctomycetota bacterium]
MQVVRVETFDDERLADYAGVRDPVRLKSRGAFLGEGRHVLSLLLTTPGYRVRSVLGTSATRTWMEREAVALPEGVPFFHIASEALTTGSGFRFHQGCLAAVDVPAPTPLDALIERVRQCAGPLVLLEAVSNPDNVGAIFRTAAAFGAAGVVLDEASASPLYRKAVRTSMGAVIRLPFHHGGRMLDHIEALSGAGVRVLALAPDESGRSIEAVRQEPGPRALLLGSEGEGLSAAALDAADLRVRIPMDRALDSLNVAAAAAIALYRLGNPGDAESTRP